MAIAFDAQSTTSQTGTTTTDAHTCTGSNLILFAGVQGGTTDIVTGVTYSGVAMTQIAKVQLPSADNRWLYLYYLVNPATGANNIVATSSGSQTVRVCGASYTGVKQTGQPDASTTATQTAGATTWSMSVTSVADNCWSLAFMRQGDGTVGAGSATTMRTVGSNFSAMFDSNAVIHPAGSSTLNFTTGNNINPWAGIIASIAPFIAAASSFSIFGDQQLVS